jgi:hypothetical protein
MRTETNSVPNRVAESGSAFHFNADPDLAFHLNADPDLAFHLNVDPDSDGNLRPLVYKPFRASF